VKLSPEGKEWELGLRTTGVGCGSSLTEVTQAELPATTDANRVEFGRRARNAEFREWYVNGPLGLEQGFVIEQPPCRAEASGAASEIVISVETEGLTPIAIDGNAWGVNLADADGRVRVGYTDLFAKDARGTVLDARMIPTRSGVELRVDAFDARFPIVIDPLVWVQRQKLLASDGQLNDRFGAAVALSGDTAIIGAYFDDDRGVDAGSAYVFTRSGTNWFEQQKLTVDDGETEDYFGHSVSISGDTALIGAIGDDNGGVTGSAYVFVRNGATWSLQQKLTASDGEANEGFALSVSISGDTALIGAYLDDVYDNGAAYVFVRSGTSWSLRQKLLASDTEWGDTFGHAVSVSGDTALIGSPGSDGQRFLGVGAAYVFVRTGTSWSEQQKIIGPDTFEAFRFGSSVSVSGDTALIGHPYEDDRGSNSGAAHVFVRTGSTWAPQQKLTAPDGDEYDYFGGGVSLAGNVALVAASRDEAPAADSGSAYLFTRSGTSWSLHRKLTASDGQAGDQFGYAASVSIDAALIAGDWNGAPGAVYAFGLASADGDPCAVGTECASGHCVDNRCCNSACVGACAACSVAAGAVTDGVCAFSLPGAAGSPACSPPLACIGTSGDCSACSADNHCASDAYCDGAGVCRPRKTQGDPCELRQGGTCFEASCRICAAGLACRDAFCCDTSCSGPCEACSSELTGGADGTCAPVPADSDPEDECEPDAASPDSCQQDGACDGARACRRFAKRGTRCGPSSCVGGTFSDESCDGSGRCATRSVACSPYMCSGQACGDSCDEHSQCASGHVCDAARGTCVPESGGGAGAGGEGSSGETGGTAGTATSGRGGSGGTAAGPGTTGGTTPDPGGEAGEATTTPAERSSASSGCGCRVSGARQLAAIPAFGLAALLLAAMRRRRESIAPPIGERQSGEL
jgi:MYXO-CTERM domain-containing protein